MSQVSSFDRVRITGGPYQGRIMTVLRNRGDGSIVVRRGMFRSPITLMPGQYQKINFWGKDA